MNPDSTPSQHLFAPDWSDTVQSATVSTVTDPRRIRRTTASFAWASTEPDQLTTMDIHVHASRILCGGHSKALTSPTPRFFFLSSLSAKSEKSMGYVETAWAAVLNPTIGGQASNGGTSMSSNRGQI